MNINLSKNSPEFLDLTWVYTTTSSTDPNTTYITVLVGYESDERDICSCPGFNYRKTCRHMNEAREHLHTQV